MRMLMSVFMPMAPRWRTSTPSVYLSRSLTVVAGMEAMDMLSRSVTMRALLCSATGTRVRRDRYAVDTLSSGLGRNRPGRQSCQQQGQGNHDESLHCGQQRYGIIRLDDQRVTVAFHKEGRYRQIWPILMVACHILGRYQH